MSEKERMLAIIYDLNNELADINNAAKSVVSLSDMLMRLELIERKHIWGTLYYREDINAYMYRVIIRLNGNKNEE